MTPSHDPSPFFRIEREEARLSLFCFPAAGRGTSELRLLENELPESIEVVPAALPGREQRLGERPFSRIADLVPALADAIVPFLTRPFAFLGYSMGALVAFELARELRRRSPTESARLERLVVVARHAPHLAGPSPIHDLPDAEFLARLQERYDALPERLLAERALLNVFLPILRADFALLETYRHAPDEPLALPISAFVGTRDPVVTPREVEAWDEHTTGPFDLELVPGGHFFLGESRERFAEALAERLEAGPLDCPATGR